MEIAYKNKRIKNICTDISVSDKIYGKEMSVKIQMRINEINAAETVEEMIKWHIGRCHKLTNNRKGQFALDLVHPYRLIFEKHGNKIQIAYILEIVDYH